MTTYATLENMRAFEQANPPRKVDTPNGPATVLGRTCFAWSPFTDERFSATPGDYWNMSEEECLLDSEGNQMVLVTERTLYLDALTGEDVR